MPPCKSPTVFILPRSTPMLTRVWAISADNPVTMTVAPKSREASTVWTRWFATLASMAGTPVISIPTTSCVSTPPRNDALRQIAGVGFQRLDRSGLQSLQVVVVDGRGFGENLIRRHRGQQLGLSNAPGPLLTELGTVLSQVGDQLAQQYIGGSDAGAKGRFRSDLNHSNPPHYQTPPGPGFVVAFERGLFEHQVSGRPGRAPSLMVRPIRLTGSPSGKFEGRTETETPRPSRAEVADESEASPLTTVRLHRK